MNSVSWHCIFSYRRPHVQVPIAQLKRVRFLFSSRAVTNSGQLSLCGVHTKYENWRASCRGAFDFTPLFDTLLTKHFLFNKTMLVDFQSWHSKPCRAKAAKGCIVSGKDGGSERVGTPSCSDCSEVETPNQSYSHNSENRPVCVICLETYLDGEMVSRSSNLCCSHVFHPECIIGWLRAKNECPCCRQTYLATPRLRT
jgi:hypothetical protein